MTCRFELEVHGQSYPRSCPTCGLGGKCQKGYEQIKEPLGGYHIVRPDGKVYFPPSFGGGRMTAEVPAPQQSKIEPADMRTRLGGQLTLSRVKRAQLADIVEELANGGKLDEQDINKVVDAIGAIVYP